MQKRDLQHEQPPHHEGSVKLISPPCLVAYEVTYNDNGFLRLQSILASITMYNKMQKRDLQREVEQQFSVKLISLLCLTAYKVTYNHSFLRLQSILASITVYDRIQRRLTARGRTTVLY
jgi:hypothetical protein